MNGREAEMKKALIIGSAAADVTIRIRRLPKSGEDVNVLSQTLGLGGCACNVARVIRRFGVPVTLFAPIGSGVYGDFVREALQREGLSSPIPPVPEPNGCCICIVEESGERTFLSHHGAEYRFRREWFRLIAPGEYQFAYVCGLELEEETGGAIADFLAEHPRLSVFFAPGPRCRKIPEGVLERVFGCSPVLHLNQNEALELSGERSVPAAARALSSRTRNAVIVTLGADGAYCLGNGIEAQIPGFPARAVDTNGAGDAHCGAVLAGTALGVPLCEAVRRANRIAAEAVSAEGAALSAERFEAAMQSPV